MSDVSVTLEPPVGMVLIRGAHDDIGNALAKALALGLPDRLSLTYADGRSLLWFSPDELLLLTPPGKAGSAVEKIGAALAGRHHLAVDVSDARVMFRLEGASGALRDTLAKLTPADMRPASFPVGMVRRTRLAQVPAAIWFAGETEARVLVFRSVAIYARDLLDNAARPGAAVGYFA